jgi:hypothetical protein
VRTTLVKKGRTMMALLREAKTILIPGARVNTVVMGMELRFHPCQRMLRTMTRMQGMWT